MICDPSASKSSEGENHLGDDKLSVLQGAFSVFGVLEYHGSPFEGFGARAMAAKIVWVRMVGQT